MEKDYKKHPFKVGDTVYTSESKGRVVSTYHPYDHFWVRIKTDDGYERLYSDEMISILSFTPYEPSNWERPFEPKDGDPFNWERPFEPKDGDFVTIEFEYGTLIGILCGAFKEGNNACPIYVGLNCVKELCFNTAFGYFPERGFIARRSTDMEIKQLLDALAKDDKHWDGDAKKIEELFSLKKGDKCIFWNDDNNFIVVDLLEERICCSHPFLPKSVTSIFQHCKIYSDELLIKIMNKTH